MDVEIKNMIYNKHRGFVSSYVCDKGTTLGRAFKNIKTGLRKGELSNQDVENILSEVYEHNVKVFESSKAYPTLFQERNNRFEIVKKELSMRNNEFI